MPVLSKHELTQVLNETVLLELGHGGLKDWSVTSLVHVVGLKHYNGSVSCFRPSDKLYIGHFFAFDEHDDFDQTLSNATRAVARTTELIISKYSVEHNLLTCTDPECNC